MSRQREGGGAAAIAFVLRRQEQGSTVGRSTADVMEERHGKIWPSWITSHAWVDVTPAFLALNKSPNKSCVFSKLTRRAQLPFKP
jgi:hypothetical protein